MKAQTKGWGRPTSSSVGSLGRNRVSSEAELCCDSQFLPAPIGHVETPGGHARGAQTGGGMVTALHRFAAGNVGVGSEGSAGAPRGDRRAA